MKTSAYLKAVETKCKHKRNNLPVMIACCGCKRSATSAMFKSSCPDVPEYVELTITFGCRRLFLLIVVVVDVCIVVVVVACNITVCTDAQLLIDDVWDCCWLWSICTCWCCSCCREELITIALDCAMAVSTSLSVKKNNCKLLNLINKSWKQIEMLIYVQILELNKHPI